jgi:hypothetical protein
MEHITQRGWSSGSTAATFSVRVRITRVDVHATPTGGTQSHTAHNVRALRFFSLSRPWLSGPTCVAHADGRVHVPATHVHQRSLGNGPDPFAAAAGNSIPPALTQWVQPEAQTPRMLRRGVGQAGD